MKTITLLLTHIIMFTALYALNVRAAEISDYLILQDIGPYRLCRPEQVFPGEPPVGGARSFAGSGIVAAAGHMRDHADQTYTVMYIGGNGLPSSKVEVTQHAGSDSDQLLMHEVEASYRDGEDSDGRLGLLSGSGIKVREISGSKLLYWGLGGGSYTWISGQKVIKIEYTDLQRTKPEPLEVIQSYLQKHPSTVTVTEAELKGNAHNEKWIKDEMDRRLWLCDK